MGHRFGFGSVTAISALVLVLACSSKTTTTGGTGGGGGSGGSAGAAGGASTCGPTCDAIDSAGCPNESKQDCLEVCNAALANCTTLSNAFGSCVQANQSQITCNTNGSAVFSVCEKEAFALLPCQVCVPRSSDTTQEKCLKEKCCAELKNAYARSDALDYTDCLTACTGSDLCKNQCNAQYPEAGNAFNALSLCSNQCPTGAG